MKVVACEKCGSNDFQEKEGMRICNYCGTKYQITQDEKTKYSDIALREDVQKLLDKCKQEPANAKKYAKLVLDIDPHNEMAKQYLADKTKKGCYIATAVYGSYDCPQVWTLRRFRDKKLLKTWYGRCFVRFYYTVSPTMVQVLGQSEHFIRICKSLLDLLIIYFRKRGIKDTPYNDA